MRRKRIKWAASVYVYGRRLPELRGQAETILRAVLETNALLKWLSDIRCKNCEAVMVKELAGPIYGREQDQGQGSGSHNKSRGIPGGAGNGGRWGNARSGPSMAGRGKDSGARLTGVIKRIALLRYEQPRPRIEA